ncbi:MAG: hypothetical protein FWD66_00460 [Paludibacter sp.]|nr:hypothetical protein [Paludibacter sp.]
MKKKKLIIWSIVLLVIVGVGFFAYSNRNGVFNWIFVKAYGMNLRVIELNDSEIVETAKSFKINSAYSLCELDSGFYYFLKSANSSDINGHLLQPLYVIYFDNTGKMVAFFGIEGTSGFPNLDWNENKDFEHFPPSKQENIEHFLPTKQENFTDSITYQILKPYFLPVKNYNPDDENIDYYVVVIWSKLMGRQSKHLIKVVQENVKLAENDNVKMIFVNIDNFFVWGEANQSKFSNLPMPPSACHI